MTKENCRDCVCIVSESNGTWVCDECGQPCDDIERCPEIGVESEEFSD